MTIKVNTPVITSPEIITALGRKSLHLCITYDLISIKLVRNKDKKFSSMYLIVKLKKINFDNP